jgi:hypothetical protein
MSWGISWIASDNVNVITKKCYSHPGEKMVQLLFQMCHITSTSTKNSSEGSFEQAEHLVWLSQDSKVHIVLNIIALILQIFCSILHFGHKWNTYCLERKTLKWFQITKCIKTFALNHIFVPSFSGGKTQPGCKADHSPPSTAKVKNE